MFFPVLEEEHLEKLEACGTILKLQPDQVLFTEGDAAYCFYIVIDGQIKITKQLGTEELVITIHQRGQFTGDLTMLTGGIASATGRSVGVSKVIQFQDFKELLKNCPSSVDLFVPALAERSKELEIKLQI